MKRGADRHYPLLPKEEIVRVMLQSPEWRPDHAGCHLWLWATRNHLPDAFWVMEALGFRYVTDFVWVKGHLSSSYGNERQYRLARPGLGQYSKSLHEHLLLGRIGGTMKPRTGDRPLSVGICSRPTEADGKPVHSAKPRWVYRNIIEPVSSEPRLEMFAREQQEGWTCVGEELCL